MKSYVASGVRIIPEEALGGVVAVSGQSSVLPTPKSIKCTIR